MKAMVCGAGVVKPVALTVNTPVVPVPVTLVTPVPPMSGLLLVPFSDQTTPRALIAAPPSLVTLPPSAADVFKMFVTVGEVIVGRFAVSVVKVPAVL